jgi:hypothetical protein
MYYSSPGRYSKQGSSQYPVVRLNVSVQDRALLLPLDAKDNCVRNANSLVRSDNSGERTVRLI